MPKQYNIRWRDKDTQELNRIVKNYNAKIKRVSDKNPKQAGFLPSKILVKDLKQTTGTRADFNRKRNAIKRFSNRDVEDIITTPGGVTITKYEIKELKNKTRIVNIKRAIQRKKLGLSVQAGTMGEVKSQNLRPKKFTLNKTQKELEKFAESLNKEIQGKFQTEKFDVYKKRYLQAIKDFLGVAGEELYQLILGMDSEEVYNKGVINPILNIGFTSDPLPVETIVKSAIEEWTE